MAKAASKASESAPKKPIVPKKVSATKKTSSTAKKSTENPYQLIEEVCVASLAKLQELELDYQLQSEINWCLGSFRSDGNPVGLYLMAERALAIFKTELAAKRKGVSAQLVKDIEKALKER